MQFKQFKIYCWKSKGVFILPYPVSEWLFSCENSFILLKVNKTRYNKRLTLGMFI